MMPAWTPEVAVRVAVPPIARRDPRLAFALHVSELANHYGPIWGHLDPDEFEIVCASADPAENERIASFAAEHRYRARFVGDVLAQGRTYAAVVSNHIGAAGNVGPQAEPAVLRLGERQVRLMYALGKDAWNFAPWNEQYDLILCWGPYQAGRLAEFERPRVVQVGYPRFDRFVRMTEPRREVVARMGGDPDRPTLVWLPTWSHQSSIDAFADEIAGLRGDFNVLLKVHPLTATTEPERMTRLADLGLRPVADVNFDNVELFHAADMVAADYGGSAFGAIYADRELVLLNTPGVGEDPGDRYVGPDSLDVRLREWILNIDPGGGDAIRTHLADPTAREQQRGTRERLRRSLFAPFNGCAGEVAATVLRNIEAILA
jgi:hypothetical protein